MNPANQHQAAWQISQILKRALPGSSKSVERHIRRTRRITALIWTRFHVGPRQWQVKHVRWALQHALRDLSASSRYEYWLACERALMVLGRHAEWLPYLQGPWLRTNGDSSPRQMTGRPAKLPGKALHAVADRRVSQPPPRRLNAPKGNP